MKKIIKEIVGMIAVTAVFAVPMVSFAAALNNDPLDFQTLRVGNYTKNPTLSSASWSTTANADAGDTLNLAVYYHNTGPDTATNVRIFVTPQTTGAGFVQSFTATVVADNAPMVSGTVFVNLSSSQSISFNGNVVWRPNQTTSGSQALPLGQTGYNAFTGQGINIGSVAPGWSTQGNLMIAFQVFGTGTGGTQSLVTTNTASNITTNSALLNGFVNGNGLSATAWFEYGTTASLGNTTPQNIYGTAPVNFVATLSGLSANTTYYYRAVAQTSQGIVYGNTLSFFTSYGGGGNYYNTLPLVSTRNADTAGDFAVLNGFVDPNGTTDTSRWFEWGGSQNFGNETQKLAQGYIASNYSATLTGLIPNTTYYYRAIARNSQGTVYGNAMSFSSGYSNNVLTGGYSTAPSATTLLATELAGSEAKLNGLVFTTANQPSNAWFEWGTNTNLGNKTQTFNVGSLPSVRHSDIISGLTVGTIYYYRVVAENPYGKGYGTIMNFVAAGSASAPVDNTVVINIPKDTTTKNTTIITTGGETKSLVSLTIDGGAEIIVGGEQRGYRVTWKNESTQNLKDVVLRVVFPSSMPIVSADKGIISKADNALNIEVGVLAKGDTGEVFVTATADRGIVKGQLIVVTANMVYTNSAGAQGDAVAYVIQHGEQIEKSSVLGASLFGSGAFLPTTLFGWILLVLLLLVLVLLGNNIYGRFVVKG
ncbi:MAG: hypothetical protein HY228_02560 [Candidatus Yonathbacteria bacterium]|nr:hypothetical protein [Candidatus Yonathbacteria bacterium]